MSRYQMLWCDMDPVRQLLTALDGKKTFLGCGLLTLFAAADLVGWLPAESRSACYAILLAAVAASLRDAIAKLPPQTAAKVARVQALLEEIGTSLPRPSQPSDPNDPPVILPFRGDR